MDRCILGTSRIEFGSDARFCAKEKLRVRHKRSTMSFFFEIEGISSEPLQRPLGNETHLMGSSNQCDMWFEHPELESRALQVDVREDDVWLQNLNPYPIYVGEEEVASNAWASWGLSETVQLTRSIKVTLMQKNEESVLGKGSASLDQEHHDGMDVSKIVQMVVAGACFLVAPLILFSGNGENAGVTQDADFSFAEVIESLESRSTAREIQVVRDHLQRAWMADQRWSRSKGHRNLVVQRYRQLVKLRLMRSTNLSIEDSDDNETMMRQLARKEDLPDDVVAALVDIKMLAQRRLADLDGQ